MRRNDTRYFLDTEIKREFEKYGLDCNLESYELGSYSCINSLSSTIKDSHIKELKFARLGILGESDNLNFKGNNFNTNRFQNFWEK